jgi:hypothetical protein
MTTSGSPLLDTGLLLEIEISGEVRGVFRIARAHGADGSRPAGR